jgi:transposase-like protein
VDKESLALLLADGVSVEKIAKQFGKDPSTVSYWMKKHGLEAPNRDKHAAKGGIERDVLEPLVEAGMTIAEIAEAVRRSKGTVRHWMRKYGLRTKNASGRESAEGSRAARAAGLLTTTMTCVRHGEAEFVLEGRGYYRCKQCRAEHVVRHRRKLKTILVEEAGGKCVLCGYDRNVRALEFHHVDPREKRLTLSANGVTLSLDALRAEARKCVLLCSNCHAEVEDGMALVPLEFQIGPT